MQWHLVEYQERQKQNKLSFKLKAIRKSTAKAKEIY